MSAPNSNDRKKNDESTQEDKRKSQEMNGEREADIAETEKRQRPVDSLQKEKKTKKQKKQHTRKKDLSPDVLEIRRRMQQCCANNDLATAMETYDQALADKVTIEAQSFYNLLNLCDGLGDRGVHIGTPKTSKTEEEEAPTTKARSVNADTRQQYAFRIKKRMDELKLPLNETAYTALVRLLSKAKLVDEAEQLLNEAEAVSQCKPRIRLYSSLLCVYCDMGQMVPALNIWSRLAKKDLVLTEKEYAALIQCAVRTGDATIMERILSDLAEDVLVPSRDTTRYISDWFLSPHATVGKEEDGTSSQSLLHDNNVELPKSDAPSMGPVQCKDTSWVVSHGCKVDTNTGVFTTGCLQGERLQPVTLSTATWQEMINMNEAIVLNGMLDNDKSVFQGGGKGPKRQANTTKRQGSWKNFQDYLKKRGRFDVVIDGANVGYYKQNFAHAPKHVDYQQIDWLLQHFTNKSVLLVLHERHFFPQLQPAWAMSICKSWENVTFRTPSGMNDDWFWLHAALYSGRETLVITNDEMRDHHFQMLAPRSFLRWKERHQVHFDFGEWKDGARAALLTYPEIYSRRIQRVANGLVVPLPKRGDEHRYLDGTHVAQDDNEEETYLCIRPSIN
jgi:pentatricopeptide repeat protein